MAGGIERLARPDHAGPPAFLAGHRVRFGAELVPGQRMADQHRVGALGIQRAIGLVGDADGGEIDAALQLQRRIRPDDEAVARQRAAFRAHRAGRRVVGSFRIRGVGHDPLHPLPLRNKSADCYGPAALSVNVFFDFGYAAD